MSPVHWQKERVPATALYRIVRGLDAPASRPVVCTSLTEVEADLILASIHGYAALMEVASLILEELQARRHPGIRLEALLARALRDARERMLPSLSQPLVVVGEPAVAPADAT